MAVLYQVEEQGRQTAFVGEKEGGFSGRRFAVPSSGQHLPGAKPTTTFRWYPGGGGPEAPAENQGEEGRSGPQGG